jgi:hypothetical protein
MNAAEFHTTRQYIPTGFGRIAYVEPGSGPAAPFSCTAFHSTTVLQSE